MQKMEVSVVIVHYNCWPYLKRNLISLRAQSEPVKQIIIINNGSLVDLDKAMSAFSDLPIELINNTKNVGFGVACNQATAFVSGDALILFCNPDVEIPTDGLEVLTQSYRHSNVDILGCQQIDAQGKHKKYFGIFPSLRSMTPLLGRFYRNRKSKDDQPASGVSTVDWISGSVMLLSKACFVELGGFDDDYFMFMEDVDLCRRAHQTGLVVGMSNETVWVHHHGKSSVADTADRIKSKTEAIKSKHSYVNKHFKTKKIPGHVLLSLKYMPELLLALVLGVIIRAKEVKVKQAVAMNLIKGIYQPAVKPGHENNNG